MKTIFAVVSLLFLTLSNAHLAQTPQAEIIRKGDKNLISVPVSVSDREGRYISGLKKEDFTIYQDGVKQNVELFATFDESLNIALLLDTSGSTQGAALEKIKDAGKDFIDLLNPADRCFVATFDSQVNVLSQFSSNHDELKKSIDKVQTASKDGTVLYQAITEVTQKAFSSLQGRKVIVVLSDGKDFGSYITRKDLLSLLEESDVMIYPIFYQTGVGFNNSIIDSKGNLVEGKPNKKENKVKKPKKPKGYVVGIPPQIDIIPQEEIKYSEKTLDLNAVDFLKELADLTAGRFYLSNTPDLGKIFSKVAGELRQQYRLGYYSKEPAKDISLHEIIVKVGRPEAVVRARTKFRGR